MKKALYAFIVILCLPITGLAASFVIQSGEVETTPQILSDSGDTGLIEEEGALVVNGAVAVRMNADNQAVLNQGTISTSGDFSDAILNLGNNSTIINTGIVSTSGASAETIVNIGSNVQITNTGKLSTSGDAAGGITNSGVGSSILNSGTISTAGSFANGILIGATGDSINIINTGEISVSGMNSEGVQTFGDNLFIFNAGTIRSAQSFAINYAGGTNFNLSLLRGSNLQGTVNVTGETLNLSVETGLNLALTLTDASPGFGTLDIEAPFVILGNTIGVVDPTGLAMQADVLADLSDTILDGIYRYSSCKCDPCRCGAWIQGIGSYRKRSFNQDFVGYNDSQGGFLVGYQRPLYRGNVNLFGGISFGDAEVDANTQTADTTSYVGGAAYNTYFCDSFFGFAIVAGYVDWDNNRYVMNNLVLDGGVENAHFDTGGIFVSPEATLIHCFDHFFCHPIMRLTVRYAGLFLGDYNEKGSLTNLTVKNREIDLLTTRLELGKSYCTTYGNCCWSFEPYTGVFGRYQVGGNTVDAELLGQSLHFDPGHPHNLAAFLLGFRGNQSIGCFNLFLNTEASFDSCRSSRLLGEGGIEWTF